MVYAYDINGNSLGGAESKETLIKIMKDNEIKYDSISEVAPKEKEPTLEQLKDIKQLELKAARDAADVLPIEYNGNTFDYDTKARERINAAIIALDLSGAKIDWTTFDDTDVKVSADDLKMIVANVAVRSNALHVAYRVAKEQLESATSKEEINEIQLEV